MAQGGETALQLLTALAPTGNIPAASAGSEDNSNYFRDTVERCPRLGEPGL